jgi:hypothetical protein
VREWRERKVERGCGAGVSASGALPSSSLLCLSLSLSLSLSTLYLHGVDGNVDAALQQGVIWAIGRGGEGGGGSGEEWR